MSRAVWQRLARADLRRELDQARVVQAGGVAGHGAGFFRDHQGLVEPARRLARQHLVQDLQGGEILVAAGRDVVGRADQANRADAAQHHVAFAVLGRLLGVGAVQRLLWFFQGTKIFGDQLECFLFLEVAAHDEHDVIGPVVFLVKRLEVFDGYALDVDAVANRILAVIVPLIRGRPHALRQDATGIVLARLELAADDHHFRGQVLTADQAVDQTIGFEAEAELEVLVAGTHDLIIIGAVVRGGGVVVGAMLVECLGE